MQRKTTAVDTGLGILVENGLIYLLLQYQIVGSPEPLPTLRVPIEASAARALASHMLAAAALVDPPGHDAILRAIAREIDLHQALAAAEIPASKHC